MSPVAITTIERGCGGGVVVAGGTVVVVAAAVVVEPAMVVIVVVDGGSVSVAGVVGSAIADVLGAAGSGSSPRSTTSRVVTVSGDADAGWSEPHPPSANTSAPTAQTRRRSLTLRSSRT
jgi:hypothetical protein